MKVMVLMESQTVTGPAKNLIAFFQSVARPFDDHPAIESVFVTFRRPGASDGFIQAVEKAGLRIVVIPEERAFDSNVLSRLREVVTEHAPDILQTHNIKSHFLMKWLGLYRTIPWIAFHHGYTATDFKMRLYNQLDRYSLRSASRVVTVCQAFADELAAKGVPRSSIAIRHNMINPFVRPPETAVTALRVSLGLPKDIPILLCVGRFSREKGHADLVQAIARLRSDSPMQDFRLVLVGEGPEWGNVKRLSQSLGVADRIIFAGYQRDVSAYYALADLYVLPSHSEGSPNTLLEAMAAGVPVVATRVGGVPEIATHHENAWLVTKGDSVDMAHAIQQVLLAATLRNKLSDNGRRVTERYTPEAYRQHMLQIYQGVLPA